MVRWHREEESESSWLRNAAEDLKSDDKGKGGAVVLTLLSANAETK